MIIRDVLNSDMSAIHDIRNYYIAHSTATVNTRLRSPEETEQWVMSGKGRYPFFVAEMGGVIIGYGGLGPFRGQDGYGRTAEVCVYIHNEHVGKGVGRALLSALCEAAPDYGLRCLISVIAGGNEGSIRLHERMGFELFGTIPKVCEKNGCFVDVLFMAKYLDE